MPTGQVGAHAHMHAHCSHHTTPHHTTRQTHMNTHACRHHSRTHKHTPALTHTLFPSHTPSPHTRQTFSSANKHAFMCTPQNFLSFLPCRPGTYTHTHKHTHTPHTHTYIHTPHTHTLTCFEHGTCTDTHMRTHSRTHSQMQSHAHLIGFSLSLQAWLAEDSRKSRQSIPLLH